MVTKKNDWTLTREALDGLLSFLDRDPIRAADEYEQIRQRLMKLFRWRGCLLFEEYTDETIDRVARRIAQGAEVRTENRYALFYGVALNVMREHWRRSEREAAALAGLTRSVGSPPNPDEVVELREAEHALLRRKECLDQCLRALPSESVRVIKSYYAEGDVLNKNQRKKIAESLKISLNSLRVRAFRIRSQVEKCAHDCVNQKV